MRCCIVVISTSLALGPGVIASEELPHGALIPTQRATISVEEPRAFSPAAAMEARSLAAAPTQRSGLPGRPPQSPVDVRLISAEQAPSPRTASGPLRLSPRSESSRTAAGGRSKPVPASPTRALTTVAGSLGIALGLLLIIAWCARRFAPAGSAILPKEAVELIGRSPLAARQQMQLVRIGNKLLLIAISPGGVKTLTEINEPAEVERLLGLCRRDQPGSSTVAFRQALAQMASEPADQSFVGASRPSSRGVR